MGKQIINELKAHAPFTVFGALTGVVIMGFSLKLPYEVSYKLFYVFHPVHVFLSALVTAAIYKLHKCRCIGSKCIQGRCNFWILVLIGYSGSVGIATISDSLIPYLAEFILGMPKREVHLGFIEKWWLVNPLAILGILFAYYKPTTKFPHSLHVLLSTWASLFHIIMARGSGYLGLFSYLTIFVFLFLAVWLPCCFSDIIFPLLFVKNEPSILKRNRGRVYEK